MLTNSEMLYEYERVFVEKRKNLNVREISDASPIGAEPVIFLFRYVFEKMLRWTPEQAVDRFDMETAKDLKLGRLLDVIGLPEEMTLPSCCFYAAAMCYPDIFSADLRSRTLMVYDRVLTRRCFRFPENFFDGFNGVKRMNICMEHAAGKMKENDGWAGACDQDSVCRFLRKYKLLSAAGGYFDSAEKLTEYAACFLK